MLRSPRDTCTHTVQRHQRCGGREGLSPSPVRNIRISTIKITRTNRDTSQPHSAQSSPGWPPSGQDQRDMRRAHSGPIAGPPPVSGAMWELRSGLPGSQRATCQGSTVRTSPRLQAGPIIPVCPVLSTGHTRTERDGKIRETGEVVSALVWWKAVG